jgi:fumarylacetoacetase
MLEALKEHTPVFHKASLNKFMSLGRPVWKATRERLIELLSKDCPALQNNEELKANAVLKLDLVSLLLPAKIGDYTDFYSSKEHATNLGKMFRPDEEALKPNWYVKIVFLLLVRVWLPVGYHGRASSVVPSGTPIRRPWGQTKPPTAPAPTFKKCARMDIELEMAFFVGPGNQLGTPISIDEAEDHIFGVVLMNDWSARDIQAWEYIPLGPFGGNFFYKKV